MPKGIKGFQKGHKGTTFWLGKKRPATSEETKIKLSLAGKGRKATAGAFKKGHTGYWLGKNRPPFTDEHKRKISKSHQGSKCYLWKGNISHLPYSTDWTRSLRISIRERDYYSCRMCGKKQGDYAFDIHHIDYNKLNCNPNNLITLCRSCHIKTNSKRDYWINYFSNY